MPWKNSLLNIPKKEAWRWTAHQCFECSMLEKYLFPIRAVSKLGFLSPKWRFPWSARRTFAPGNCCVSTVFCLPHLKWWSKLAETDCHKIPHAFMHPWSCFKVELGVFEQKGFEVLKCQKKLFFLPRDITIWYQARQQGKEQSHEMLHAFLWVI